MAQLSRPSNQALGCFWLQFREWLSNGSDTEVADKWMVQPLMKGGTMAIDYEPYADAYTVAEFLKVKRKTVLEWVRRRILTMRGAREGGDCGAF